ncbi:MAG: hypothetical protein AB7F82_08965, partial [Alphaproteobacteria bacterium]
MEAFLKKQHDNASYVIDSSGIDFQKIAEYMKIEDKAQQQVAQHMRAAATQLCSGKCKDVREALKQLGLNDRQLHIALEAIHTAAFPKDRLPLP